MVPPNPGVLVVQLRDAPVAVACPVADPPPLENAEVILPSAPRLPLHENAPFCTVVPVQELNAPDALPITKVNVPVLVPAIVQL